MTLTKDMEKERYELYTLGDYDLFIDNLKWEFEFVQTKNEFYEIIMSNSAHPENVQKK